MISTILAIVSLSSMADASLVKGMESALSDATENALKIKKEAQKGLTSRYAGLRLEISNHPRLVSGTAPRKITSIQFLGENHNGEAILKVKGTTGAQFHHATMHLDFSAWMKLPVAKKRIPAGHRLSKELFSIQEVDVSRGMKKQTRGLALTPDTDFSKFEARTSLLEGHFPLLNGVREVPNVRRGDTLKIRLVAGGLTVSTSGIAQADGYQNKSLKVLTQKGKRVVSGVLKEGNVLEVEL